MTPQQIEAVLRPPWPGEAHRLVPWAATVIAAQGWRVRLGAEFAAFRHQGVIEVPAGGLITDAAMAALLHEAGHLADPRVRPRKVIEDDEPMDRRISIESECAAWLCAMQLAGRRWTRAMQRSLESCLGSYRDAYVAPYSMPRRLIGDTIAYTAARLRRRGVVCLRDTDVKLVEAPESIRPLIRDIEDWRSVCPR